MIRAIDRPILIQRINETTEMWDDMYILHANVNKANSNNEYLNAGAIQDKVSRVFEVRYFKAIEDIEHNTQKYRIVYQGVPYNITDYDDFMFRHKTVKLLGVSY